jgi:hypothetical protein
VARVSLWFSSPRRFAGQFLAGASFAEATAAREAMTPEWLRHATQRTQNLARSSATFEAAVALFAVAFVSFHMLFG